jgi:hypothetical protein
VRGTYRRMGVSARARSWRGVARRTRRGTEGTEVFWIVADEAGCLDFAASEELDDSRVRVRQSAFPILKPPCPPFSLRVLRATPPPASCFSPNPPYGERSARYLRLALQRKAAPMANIKRERNWPLVSAPVKGASGSRKNSPKMRIKG